MRIVAGLLLALIIGSANEAYAAEPTYEQWAAQGARLQRTFQCAALAEHGQKHEEAKRLFNAALDIGRPFVGGVFAGRIKPRNDLWIVPIGLLGCFAGPNAEFVLGRMWECSRESALTFIRQEKIDEQPEAARREFDRSNCAFIAVPNMTK
jgi:hypothetical protein